MNNAEISYDVMIRGAHNCYAGMQVCMCAHNQGCVTSLVSLQHFCVNNGSLKKKEKNKYVEQLLWRSPPAKKRQTELEQKKKFFF